MRCIIVLLIAAISLTCIPHETVYGEQLIPTLIPPEIIRAILAKFEKKGVSYQDLLEFQRHRIQYMHLSGDYDEAGVCKFN